MCSHLFSLAGKTAVVTGAGALVVSVAKAQVTAPERSRRPHRYLRIP
jgi:hypothetical protein